MCDLSGVPVTEEGVRMFGTVETCRLLKSPRLRLLVVALPALWLVGVGSVLSAEQRGGVVPLADKQETTEAMVEDGRLGKWHASGALVVPGDSQAGQTERLRRVPARLVRRGPQGPRSRNRSLLGGPRVTWTSQASL